MIKIEKIGRERICSLSLAPLEEVAEWVKQYESFWMSKLDRLDEYLRNEEQ